MKLIVGLGNPGPEYNFTRHNFGFLALDFYAKTHNLAWQKPKFGALWLKTSDATFIKPQDFYNNSGQAVQAFARFYKITPADILVVCDDLNLPFGKLRLRQKGSAGGNNGLKSIIAHLGTEDFPRLRLGTDNDLHLSNNLHRDAQTQPAAQIGDIDFVLGHFTATEKSALPDILTATARELDAFQQG